MKTSAYLLAFAVLALAVAAATPETGRNGAAPSRTAFLARRADRRLVSGRKQERSVGLADWRPRHADRDERPHLPGLPDPTHDVNDPEQLTHAQEQVVCRDAQHGRSRLDRTSSTSSRPTSRRRAWAGPAWPAIRKPAMSTCIRSAASSAATRRDGKVVWEYSLHEEFGKVSGYGGRTHDADHRRGSRDRELSSALTWAESAVLRPEANLLRV